MATAVRPESAAGVVRPAPSQPVASRLALGARTGQDEARRVADQHQRNLSSRRLHDLTREKYLLHIDGEGDNQYADILYGSRVAIPPGLSPYRRQENLLRPIVDNMVAWHTTMPFRYAVETRNDAQARLRGKIDEVFANYVARQQRLNEIFAQGMFLATAAGFCPVHAYWRSDSQDDYEAVSSGQPSKGMIDAWVGNPFDTTFNAGAKFGSLQGMWYGRVLPADLVRAAFPGVPIEGTTRLPSASVFQRVLRKWYSIGTQTHGTATLVGGQDSEELVALVCREIAPGIQADWPQGRLTIVALQGISSSDPSAMARTAGSGGAVLLADQALPGGRFSATSVYSHHAFDDIHGKPFVADLDDLQVALNLALSDRREYTRKSLNAPTIVNGRLVDDLTEYNGYTLLEMEPIAGGGTNNTRMLELPSSPVALLNADISELRQAMFTLGGYQAASRGEAPAGAKAYRAIVALQQADDTIHGPTNVVFRGSGAHFMQTCWALMKTYGDVPWLIDLAGSDYAHLADSYIDRLKLSDELPQFRLVNFAGTPESRMQTMLNLVTTRGADGFPLMTTEEFRRKAPDSTLYDTESQDPREAQRRRALTITQAIRDMARQLRAVNPGLPAGPLTDPMIQQAAQQVFYAIEQQYPRLQDDDLTANLVALTELTQDETEDAIARAAAIFRQQLFWQWQAMMAAQGQPATGSGMGRAVLSRGGGSSGSSQPSAGTGEPSSDQNPLGGQFSPEQIASEVHGTSPAGQPA